MTIKDIAKIAHEANRAYCSGSGDTTQLPWEEAPDWQKESAIAGVEFHFAHPDASPSASHEAWLAHKVAYGWKYGPVKDVDKKEHPCMVRWEELPLYQRRKDVLFKNIVETFL